MTSVDDRPAGDLFNCRPVPASSENAAARLRFRVVDNEQDFLSLRPSWDALALRQDRNSLSLGFAWALAAWETIARPSRHDLAVIVVEAEERVVLVFPFTLQRLGPFRIGRWLGPDLYECCDVLIAPVANDLPLVADAWEFARSHFHLLRFPVVRTDARIWPQAERSPGHRWEEMRLPSIDCRRWPDWNSYYASRSQSFRQDCKKSDKRLRKIGTPTFAVVDREERLDQSVDWIFARKIEWLVHTGRKQETRAFSSRKAFVSRICREALRTGDLVLMELMVDDVRVAAQLALRAGDRLECMMIAWAYGWHECGPGRTVLLETIRWAFDHGIRSVDLSVGGDEYKYRLTDEDIAVAYHAFVPTHVLGRGLPLARAALRSVQHGLQATRRLAGLGFPFRQASAARPSRGIAQR
jgi:CelD/BcsL family acetyltransferase involved in cellulose biosynthesis